MTTCHLCGRETTAHPANHTLYPVCECGDEIDTLRARVAVLEAALEQHWEHALRCPAQRVTEDDDSSCNCGLWQILAPKQ